MSAHEKPPTRENSMHRGLTAGAVAMAALALATLASAQVKIGVTVSAT